MADEVVAWLSIQVAGVEAFDTHGGYIEVCGNEQFYLGRDPELCRYSWSDDLTISRKHLRIHCILYEQDPVAQIAPLVYATDLSANGTYLKKRNTACVGSQGREILMGNSNCFLLEHGDELRISDTVTLVYTSKTHGKEAVLSPVQQREKQSFASRYLVTGRMLGEGGYGRVLVGINQDTQRQLACKVVRIDHLHDALVTSNLEFATGERGEHKLVTKQRWPTKVANCFREFDILKDLSHPNVVALEKVFWSPNTIYLFQELVTGGDLFSFLEFKGGRLSSIHSAVIIRQVLKGVEYLHNHDIVHRDLKPDNILMTSLDDGARVVITDFGNARLLPNAEPTSHIANNQKQRMFSYVGTLEFAAPEIHKANKTIPTDKGYSKSVDMWSIGSVTATVLTGDVIFTDRTHPKYEKDPRSVIMTLAGKCDLCVLDDKHHPVWATIGNRPKDFIRRLLVLDEEARMTATEALYHPWFSAYAEEFQKLYTRSIKEWKPRERNLKLVERISTFVPGPVKCAFFKQGPGEGSISPFSQSIPQGVTQATQESLAQDTSSTNIWRTDTPLPSIWQDHKTGQFASRGQSQLRDVDDFLRESLDRHIAVSGSNQHSAGDNHSEQSSESLKNVHKSFFQQIAGKKLPQTRSYGETHESVLVAEEVTPLAEQSQLVVSDCDGRKDEEWYQQMQCPVESRRQDSSGVDQQSSVLVYETPPEVGRKHQRSIYSTYSQDLQQHSSYEQQKRRRRSRPYEKIHKSRQNPVQRGSYRVTPFEHVAIGRFFFITANFKFAPSSLAFYDQERIIDFIGRMILVGQATKFAPYHRRTREDPTPTLRELKSTEVVYAQVFRDPHVSFDIGASISLLSFRQAILHVFKQPSHKPACESGLDGMMQGQSMENIKTLNNKDSSEFLVLREAMYCARQSL
ncbi:hypothetical protein LEMA_P023260.1 [Plenodomus lingam JN3]|uniref:Uncharacterized protein n=1 Tax=Leptosphaeria maculans (strain JN3 / isolate v23.1.3 / race Av1-4-5-6-7-8) TaxID=985895 RepID=E5AC05_LEPMJ|nr:hypothetical protein LEMA_P023260.1 [Plenodomus lingam JN3]CBY01196.1 hypothetical protein LEMA_P023260.1 [Plenodomus lingam JN3]